MNLDEIIEEIKIFYKNHDDLEEILHDLKENNYLDHWANKFCEERFPSNKKLGKALYIISIENAKNSKDYANLAQSIAYYYGLNDKEWAEDIYKKALKSTKDITLTLSIIEDIADEKYINKKAFAKELCLKIEPKISKLSDYILFRDIVKEKIEDKNWADKIVSKSIEVIKKNKI